MAVIVRDCPHCPAGSIAFQLVWAASFANVPNTWNCAAVCGSCGKPISFQARGASPATMHSPPTNYGGNIEGPWAVGEIWPSRPTIGAPRHTPVAVSRRFIQGENAYTRGDWNAAVAMYRSTLDIATKGMEGVPVGTFFNRLKWLHEEHRITPDMWTWATHVRLEGNDALHDPEEFTEEDAKALRLFTETFLRYVFELPGEVRDFRGEDAADAPPA